MSGEAKEQADPDPFSIALGIFGIAAAGASFLETRRARQFLERQQEETFRSAWFAANRTLIHFRRVVDEFEAFMLEDGYGAIQLRIGMVRLTVDRGRHQALRRLHGQVMTTSNFIADNLDDLSDFLGPDDQSAVDAVHDQLKQLEIPGTFADAVAKARVAIDAYGGLLASVNARKGFVKA